MFNKFPFFNNFENDNDDEASNIPNLFILGSGKIPENLNKPRLLCSIMDGEYGIFINGETDDCGTSKFLLECSRTKKAINGLNYTIFDAYDFLSKTHFINFLIAKVYKKQAWAFEGINTTMQIMDTTDEKYSKIMILVETSNVPNYISEGILIDTFQETSSTMDSAIYNSPAFVNVTKSKSYYRPIVSYSISIGFNRNSQITFDNIRLSMMYEHFLKPYIIDAIFTFYAGILTDDIFEKYGEKLVRVQYIVNCTDRLMDVKLICVPAIYFSNDCNISNRYSFVNDNLHLIGCENLDNSTNDILGVSCINNIMSSDVSQTIALSSVANGIITEFCNEYSAVYHNFAIFTLNRIILRSDELKNNKFPPTIIVDNEEISSKFDYVLSYWKPRTTAIINTSLNKLDSTPNKNFPDMRIYGFINIKLDEILEIASFEDFYSEIHNEIFEIFGLTKKNYDNNDFGIIKCYENLHFMRLMIYSVLKDDKTKNGDNCNKEKKHKIWRNKN